MSNTPDIDRILFLFCKSHNLSFNDENTLSNQVNNNDNNGWIIQTNNDSDNDSDDSGIINDDHIIIDINNNDDEFDDSFERRIISSSSNRQHILDERDFTKPRQSITSDIDAIQSSIINSGYSSLMTSLDTSNNMTPITTTRSESVRVICRVRHDPSIVIENDNKNSCVELYDNNNNSIKILTQPDELFTFDTVYGPKATQEDIFHNVALPLVHDVLNGINGTIFAYGQTASGKTYTMEGDLSISNLNGIIPRIIHALYNTIDVLKNDDDDIEYEIIVNFVEIYMEKIRDLLDNKRNRVNLNIREDKDKGIYIEGAKDQYVRSVDDMMNVMIKGTKNRSVAATGMNEVSSRSHSIFIIKINRFNETNGTSIDNKLILVDLAGSEKVSRTNATGIQLEEAKTINKSLSTLGTVISTLSHNKKKSHIPYRDSKLTRILQDSLGGNSKTVLIITCSPSILNMSETQSTLKFGQRAKRIKNIVTTPKLNDDKTQATSKRIEELEALLLKAGQAIDAQQNEIMQIKNSVRSTGTSSQSSFPTMKGNVNDTHLGSDTDIGLSGTGTSTSTNTGAINDDNIKAKSPSNPYGMLKLNDL